jgi:hypothetical protein
MSVGIHAAAQRTRHHAEGRALTLLWVDYLVVAVFQVFEDLHVFDVQI